MKKTPWVLVAAGFHSNGGMDKANLVLAEYLADLGAPVHLVTHRAEQTLYTKSNVTIHRIALPFQSFALGEPILDFCGRRIASKIKAQFSDSIVVVNGGGCRWPGINWSHYVHHAWQSNFEDQGSVQKKYKSVLHDIYKNNEKSAYQQARLIIANSNMTRNHLLEYFRLTPDKVKTLYLGADPAWKPATATVRASARAKFQLSPTKPYAVFVGALGGDGRKGLDTLMKAWKQLCEDDKWDVDLLVAGTGRSLNLWRSKIKAWGLEGRIQFLGFCSDIRTLLAASDLLVSPTRYEPYGLNVQEAICCGLPVIVSASAGIAERYPTDLKPLLLSDHESVIDLMRTLRAWRANVAMWVAKFEPLKDTLRSNTWRDMARSFVSLATEPS